MSKRVNPEEKIVKYFSDAPLSEVTVVFNIVNGIVKSRKAANELDAATTTPKKRRKAKRVKSQAASAGTVAGDQDDSSEA